MKGGAAFLAWFVPILMTGVTGCRPVTPPQAPRFSTVIGKVWLHVEGDWITSPNDPDTPSIRSAPATMIRLSADHEFSMLQGWITEYRKSLSISPGDPHRVFIGKWAVKEQAINVVYRLVYELVQPVGGTYPGPEQNGTIVLTGKSIRFLGIIYKESSVPLKTYEEFIAPERTRLSATK
jgi:hypothetical protein